MSPSHLAQGIAAIAELDPKTTKYHGRKLAPSHCKEELGLPSKRKPSISTHLGIYRREKKQCHHVRAVKIAQHKQNQESCFKRTSVSPYGSQIPEVVLEGLQFQHDIRS